MSKPPLQQQKILAFIANYKAQFDGTSPTQLEIATKFGISQTTVQAHLSALFRKGRITFDVHGRVLLVGGTYKPPDL